MSELVAFWNMVTPARQVRHAIISKPQLLTLGSQKRTGMKKKWRQSEVCKIRPGTIWALWEGWWGKGSMMAYAMTAQIVKKGSTLVLQTSYYTYVANEPSETGKKENPPVSS